MMVQEQHNLMKEGNMKLNIKERLVLLAVLPAEGNFLTLKIVRKLRENLSFSEEELEQYKFKEDNSRLTWDETNQEPKDVVIGKEGKKIIKDALKKLDKEEKLKEDHVSVYEKFVGKEDD